jgi:hypothetical protein
MRAQFGAAYQFSLTLVGATVGPAAVALLTDDVYGSEARVGWSLVTVAAVANPTAALLLWLGYRHSLATATRSVDSRSLSY